MNVGPALFSVLLLAACATAPGIRDWFTWGNTNSKNPKFILFQDEEGNYNAVESSSSDTVGNLKKKYEQHYGERVNTFHIKQKSNPDKFLFDHDTVAKSGIKSGDILTPYKKQTKTYYSALHG